MFIKLNNLKILYANYHLYFKSASTYLFASLFAAGLKIAVNPLLAKNLSHDDYAIIGYFLSFNALALPILTFMVFSYYQRNYYLVSEEKRQKIVNTIILFLTGMGIFPALLILLGLFLHFKISKVNIPYMPYAFFLVYQIFFNSFLTFLQVNHRLKREARKYAQITIISALTWLILSVLLVVVFRLGAKGSMGATLIVAIGMGIYSVKHMLTKFEFDHIICKDLLKFCWPLTISSILWYFLAGIDGAMLEKLNDRNTYALYSIGLSLSGSLAMCYTAISQTFEPDIYKAISEKNLRKITKIIFTMISINAIPIILFIIAAVPLTDMLTAGRYTDAAPFAKILSLKNITMSFYYNVLTIIVGFGFTKADLILRTIGAVFSVIMYSFLIKHFAFWGAAWGQVFIFLFLAIIGLLYIFYKLKDNTLYENCI